MKRLPVILAIVLMIGAAIQAPHGSRLSTATQTAPKSLGVVKVLNLPNRAGDWSQDWGDTLTADMRDGVWYSKGVGSTPVYALAIEGPSDLVGRHHPFAICEPELVSDRTTSDMPMLGAYSSVFQVVVEFDPAPRRQYLMTWSWHDGSRWQADRPHPLQSGVTWRKLYILVPIEGRHPADLEDQAELGREAFAAFANAIGSP